MFFLKKFGIKISYRDALDVRASSNFYNAILEEVVADSVDVSGLINGISFTDEVVLKNRPSTISGIKVNFPKFYRVCLIYFLLKSRFPPKTNDFTQR